MPIRFFCVHCQAALSIGTRKGHAHIHCPRCKADITVPAGSDPGLAKTTALQRTAPMSNSFCPDLIEPPPPPLLNPKPPAVPQRGLALRFPPRRLLTGMAVLLLLGGAAGAIAALTLPKSADPPPPEEPAPVQRAYVPAAVPDAPIDLPQDDPPPAAKAEQPAPVLLDARVPPTPKPAPKKQVTVAVVKPRQKPARAVLSRLQKLDAEELRKQLLDAPEIALDSVPNTSRNLLASARTQHGRGLAFAGPAALRSQRTDLASLPLRMGKDCHLGKEPAEALQVLSRMLRAHLDRARQPGRKGGIEIRLDADALRRQLAAEDRDWLKPEAVPTLMQMLQGEDAPARRLLVELLGKIKGRKAAEALAMRAAADLSAEVREQAVAELKKRPAEDYADVLLSMLRYPWAPAAQHAAEALTALDVKEALPQLVKMLDEPDPTLPAYVRKGWDRVPMVSEVVRVNHLSNCLLCHAPSLAATDLVRGAVPDPNQPLPPSSTPAYYERGGVFVRADVTYLRQDFSVVQTVENARIWPAHQRFDYLVRQRQVSVDRAEAVRRKYKEEGKRSPQREALLFVLRELTGEDRGTRATDWLPVLPPEQRPVLVGAAP
jgi:HEAT repeat protein